MLHERVADRHEIEYVVIGSDQVATPEGEGPVPFLDADRGPEQAVKRLTQRVLFVPIEGPGAAQIAVQQNAVDPFAYVDRVVPAQSKGVSRSVGNIVSRIGGCAAVVAQETGIRVSVTSVEGKVGDRIGDRGFGPEEMERRGAQPVPPCRGGFRR